MQQINYHTNTIIEPTTTLTHAEANTIRIQAYNRGLRAGIIITTIITLTIGYIIYLTQ